jgi:diguanylate cyclase (GGDEF)-like protein
MVGFVLSVHAVALALGVRAILTSQIDSTSVVWFVALLGLAILFEEGTLRVEKFRIKIRATRHTDMTSVWTFAAAIVLAPSLTLPLVVLIQVHTWYRYVKARGGIPYRTAFTGASIWIACVAARSVMDLFGARGALPMGVGAVIAVVCAMVVYSLMNTGLIYTAVCIGSRPASPPPFLTMWQDNLLELATLCLAALTALALLFEPWMTVLVIPAMVIMQRSVLSKELQEAATMDAKTGLLNALAWQQAAIAELERSARNDKQAAMLIIDMDNFKLINDTYGHLVGDSVLKAVADVLTDELRGYDVIGRFGGEEFVALLADVSPLQALDISDRILQRVRDLRVPTRDPDKPMVTGMSASIGMSGYPQQASQVDDLLHIADAALYTAKREGRDRVEYSYIGGGR